jgi:hypothetical protein
MKCYELKRPGYRMQKARVPAWHVLGLNADRVSLTPSTREGR